MLLYFFRHGQSEGNKAGIISGQDDHPLTREGEEEAVRAAKNIPTDVSIIYSSDLTRCKQTAEILNMEKRLPIIYDVRLRERDFGSLAGKMWSEVDVDGSLYAKDRAQQYDYQPYGGESVEQVTKRLHDCIENIKAAVPAGHPLIVTSAGIIRLLNHLYGDKELRIPNASVREFDL